MQHGGEGERERNQATEGNARRDFLKKAGIAGAVAWTAPTLLSTAAHAQGTGNPNIQWVGVGTEGAGTGSSVSAGVPAGVQAGDLLVAAISSNGASTMTAPTGWTTRIDDEVTTGFGGLTRNRLYVWTRTATASEPGSITFTRNISGTGAQFRAVIIAYRNVASVSAPTSTDAGSAGSHTFPTRTTSVANSLVLWVGLHANGTATWSAVPSGHTQRHESASGTRGLLLFDQVQPTTGLSGGPTVALSSNQSAVRGAMVLDALP